MVWTVAEHPFIDKTCPTTYETPEFDLLLFVLLKFYTSIVLFILAF